MPVTVCAKLNRFLLKFMEKIYSLATKNILFNLNTTDQELVKYLMGNCSKYKIYITDQIAYKTTILSSIKLHSKLIYLAARK